VAATLGTPADAFVTKLHFDDTTLILGLVYSTYLGGSSTDTGNGIAVDSADDVYVTGQTQSIDFPQVNALSGSSFGSPADAFVAKITESAAPTPPGPEETTGVSGGCFVATASAFESQR
jgi:hypothetical protein